MLLVLENISKHYTVGDTIIRALDQVSISVDEGEYVAVMGHSGSGKSTLLQIASFLDKPTTGSILLRGKKVENYSENEMAGLRNREIGFVFQQFNLLPKTSAIENVALPLVYANVPAQERTARAEDMLREVGLGDRLKNTRAQLSGGQQQRVAIARALINNPSIVFADEPTGNLDSKSGEEIMDMLDVLHKKGKTIILVTHEADIAHHAKRRIVMRDGHIISDSKDRKKKV
ncbi:MAG: ABC transporter ATP-binding protein [Candidatus Pacebacteria bacterium]|nr:ABC transporter ATP-binding protein [Candidatus Paceibacterota bacterium]